MAGKKESGDIFYYI